MKAHTGESVLSRAVRIFEAFTADDTTLTISEIARRTNLHVATVSRMVAELTAHGFLARDAERRVRIGVRLWELAMRASPTRLLRDTAMPFMEGVHDVVGHHVQLSVLDDDEVLFLERLSTPDAVVNYTRIAGRLPAHASSSGLVLLAHCPAGSRERVLEGPLRRYTSHTPSTATQLRASLAAIRQQGYALCPGYLHEDAVGIAAPVRDADGEVVAALGAIVPRDEEAGFVVPVIRTAARGISRALAGGRHQGRSRPATDGQRNFSLTQ